MRSLLSLLLVAMASVSLAGDFHYQGEQTLFQDTVWQGEVLIDGILTVPPGVTLEIRPGTVVRFTPFDSNGDGIGEHEIFLQGSLQALGSAEAPIVFTAAGDDPRPGSWGAINIMASEEGNLLVHCRVEYAYRGFHAHFSRAEIRDCEFTRNVRALQFQESTLTIERCRVAGNLNGLQFRDSVVVLADSVVADNYWGVRGVYSQVELRGCQITGNLVNGANLRASQGVVAGNVFAGNRKGLYLQQVQQMRVEENLLADNSEHGIFLELSEALVHRNRISGNGRAGIRWLDAQGSLRGNDLAGNGGYALINDGATPVDARENWWGSTEEGEIAALVRDAADRPEVGPVDAAAPLAQAPVLPAFRQTGNPRSASAHADRD